MEPDNSFSNSPNQTALQQAELAAILRMLSISEGTFSLSIAICNSPALREYLIGKIAEHKTGIEKIPIEKNCTDMLAFAEKKITTKRPSAIFITEIENALSSDDVQPRIIRNLNASRELWQQKFSCPVIFWLAEYAATMLQKYALDFASWVSHRFEFVSEQATAAAGTLDAFAGNITSAGRLDADQKRFRIAELEQRIDEAGDPPKAQFVQHVLTWLNELTYIYHAIGDLDRAQRNATKSLEIAGKLGLQAATANAYACLGVIYQTCGELDKAEQMHKKSLEINEKLRRLEGMAHQYGNLGLIYQIRGELDKAEQMHKKSLDIEEKLGQLEGMASDYGNLGLVYKTRGEFAKAEKMYRKSLDIFETTGRPVEMATVLGNLGVIYMRRGDLDKAEKMYREALVVDDRIGHLEGVAMHYCNLGVVYNARGDSEKAQEMFMQSLKIHGKLNNLEGIATACGNLGAIYHRKGELDRAEEMYQRALEIDKKIGHLEGVARHSTNLGVICEERGNISKAGKCWQTALELFKKIGMKPEIEKVQGWIDGLKDK